MAGEEQNLAQRLQRVTRVLQAMRAISRVTQASSQTDELLSAVCDHLVGICGYRGAWIIWDVGHGDQWRLAACQAGEAIRRALERCVVGGLPICAHLPTGSSCRLRSIDGLERCLDCPVRGGSEGSSSLVLRSIVGRQQTYGMLVLDDPEGFSIAGEEDDLLREIANDIGHDIDAVIMRHRQETDRQELQQRFEVERCIVRISRLLAGGDETDREAIMRELGSSLQTDRAMLYRTDESDGILRCCAAWNTPGLEPPPEEWLRLVVQEIPWWMEQLEGGEPVVLGRLCDLPERAAAERVKLLLDGVEGLVVYPLRCVDGCTIGFVSVCQRRPRQWSQDDIGAVEVVSEMLGAREGRMDAQRELQAYAKELDELNQRLQDQQIQLLQMQKMEAVGQLAAGVAHEINTPIQFIGDNVRFLEEAFADVLAYESQLNLVIAQPQRSIEQVRSFVSDAREQTDLDYLNEEIPKAVRQTLEGVERVATIVKAMKEFAHPGDANMAPADLNRAIESTLVVSRNEYKYVAEMETDLAADLPPVPCDLGAIKQMVLNLVVNAAHAIEDRLGDSGGRGRIVVATRLAEDHVQLTVGDDGCGIPEEQRQRIFEPFYTTKDVGRGSGQGLALIHKIVISQHGGRIDLESEPGRGSTFIISLPLVAEAKLSATTARRRRAEP